MPDPKNANAEGQQNTDPPWYDKYGLPSEDHGIMGKYKDESEALKSIGARERALSQSVRLPDAKADPKDRAKSTREILGRLGALDSPDKYKALMTERIPAELKDQIDDAELDKIAKRAHDTGMLPEAFTSAFEDTIAGAMTSHKARKDAEADKLRRAKADDEQLDQAFGREKTARLKDAEAFAKHYDDTLFHEDNLKAMSPEEYQEKGGLLFRRLKEINDPYLWRLVVDMHHRVYGEGPGPGNPTNPPGTRNDWQKHYEYAKANYGTLGEDRCRQYADEMTGARR